MCQLWYVCELQPVRRLQFVCELCSEYWLQRVQRRLRHDKLCRAGSGLRIVCRASGRSAHGTSTDGTSAHDRRTSGTSARDCRTNHRCAGPDHAGRRSAECCAADNVRENGEAGNRAGVETDSASRHPVELDAGAAAVRSARPDRGPAELFGGRDSSGCRARCGPGAARRRRLGAGAKLKAGHSGVPETRTACRPRWRRAALVSCFAVAPWLAESRQLG